MDCAPTINNKKDYTCAAKEIDYNDFLELFCRIVCSELWIYTEPETNVSASDEGVTEQKSNGNDNNDNSDGLMETKVSTESLLIQGVSPESSEITASQVLASRLFTWTNSFDFLNLKL